MKPEWGSRLCALAASCGSTMMRLPIGSVPPSGAAKRMAPEPTTLFGTVSVSTTFVHTPGFRAAKYSPAARTSASDIGAALGRGKAHGSRADHALRHGVGLDHLRPHARLQGGEILARGAHVGVRYRCRPRARQSAWLPSRPRSSARCRSRPPSSTRPASGRRNTRPRRARRRPISVPPSGAAKRMAPEPTTLFGTVSVSTTFVHTPGFRAAKYSPAARTSASDIGAALGRGKAHGSRADHALRHGVGLDHLRPHARLQGGEILARGAHVGV